MLIVPTLVKSNQSEEEKTHEMSVKRRLVIKDRLALEAGERLVRVVQPVVFTRRKNAGKRINCSRKAFLANS